MSNGSSDRNDEAQWNGWFGVAAAAAFFIGAQIVAGVLLSLYPSLRGWTRAHASSWLNDSLAAQLVFLALANAFIFVAIWLFLRKYRRGFGELGLVRPKWADPLYSLGALPVYFILLALSVTLAKALAPSLNVDQVQDLGFNGSYNGTQLVFIAISLVILPPLTEEVVFRGLIFTSLKKNLPVAGAALITSVLFALGHLPEGGGGGPLYIAAIDTFILSLVLCYLRQKTGRLWAPIGLHALKNGIAFTSLFLLHVH